MTTDSQADFSARLDATARGEAGNLIAEMRSGYAVLGDTQHLPGYCLLLYRHRVEHLDDLPDDERIAFLFDLSLLGEAVRVAVSAQDPELRRINYEVLGNSWPHLHGHVHARYEWEPANYRFLPVWHYPDRNHPQHRLDQRHEYLRIALIHALSTITGRAYRNQSSQPARP